MCTQDDIKTAIKNAKLLGPIRKTYKSISTDSRTISAGELFIPLQGDRFDGRKFISAALKKGATALDTRDGLKNYQKIAAAHRRKFGVPVIGITGSSGKTTTKDLLAAVLAQKWPVLKSQENFNNEIGVPKTLLKLSPKHRAAIIEMAMQGPGEIAEIAEIASPTIAIITNIGEAHLKQLKNRKNIACAKSEIIDHLPRGGYLILNADDDFYPFMLERARQRGIKVISFGIKTRALVSPRNPAVAAVLRALKLPGEHNVYNALAAIAAAKILKVSGRQICAGLRKVKTSKHRMKIIRRKGITIIDDTYNANPSSMRAALEMLVQGSRFKSAAGGQGFSAAPTLNLAPRTSNPSLFHRQVAILGDMLELGPRAVAYHKEIGKLAADLGIDVLIGVGKLARHYLTAFRKAAAIKKRKVKTYHFKTTAAATERIKKISFPACTLLVKGSRGMGMEKIAASHFI